MRTTALSFLILFLIPVNTFAQNAIFRAYNFECSQLFDIELKKPKGFKVINGTTPFRVNEKDNIGTLYRMTLSSKAKDCLILFPYFFTHRHHECVAKTMVYEEVKSALNSLPGGKSLEQDASKYIRMITNENMENYFNADTVFIYRVPFLKPYKEVYNECIGINIIKKGHPSAMIKILFKDECEKKEEYMQQLFESVCYSDVAPNYEERKKKKR